MQEYEKKWPCHIYGRISLPHLMGLKENTETKIPIADVMAVFWNGLLLNYKPAASPLK